MSTIDNTPYKLLDWVYTHFLNDFWKKISENPNAIYLLEQNPDKIDWEYLSYNPNAIHILKQNQDKIDWENLSL